MTDPHLNLIDGTWMPGDHLTENRNPSDLSDLIGHYAAGTADDVDRATQAATAALPAWQAKGPLARGDAAWIAWASNSLPVPVSPNSNTGLLD